MLHIKAREFAQNGNVEVGGIADISEEWPEGGGRRNDPPGLSAGKEESDYHESHRVGLPAQRPCLGVVQLHPGVDGQRADRRKPFSGGAH